MQFLSRLCLLSASICCLSTTSYANDIVLYPPQNVDLSQCTKSYSPPHNLAKNLDLSSIAQSGISDSDLYAIARIYRDGYLDITPDLSKTKEILEYLINKTGTENSTLLRALRMKAHMVFKGSVYAENPDLAKKMLQDLIDAGHPEIKFDLAKLVYAQDQDDQAIALYKEALIYINPSAALSLAYLYANKSAESYTNKAKPYIIMAQNLLLEKIAQGECRYFGTIADFYLRLKHDLPNKKNIAAQWLSIAAQLDDYKRKLQLAELIETNKDNIDTTGLPTPQKLWREAALVGSTKAMHLLGESLLKKNASPQLEKEALEWFEKAAEKGHKAATLRLINYYQSQKNIDRSLYWLEKAMMFPDIDAKTIMTYANLLRGDRDSRTPFETIYTLYERAGRQGDSMALFMMGEAHRNGLGVAKNPTKALRFYRLAAKFGNLKAYDALASAYQCGIGKPINPEKAQSWIERSQYFGSSSLYDDLENKLQMASNRSEKEDIIKDYLPRIRNILSRKNNDAKTSVKLNRLYTYLGDDKAAERWLRMALYPKSADRLNANGAYHYAKELMDGVIVAPDFDKGKEWLEKAAQKDNIPAIRHLGKIAASNNDADTAIKYYHQAMSMGDNISALRLASIEKSRGHIKNAVSYLERLASLGHTKALFELAKGYGEKGWITPANPEKAKAYFKQASEANICDPDDIFYIIEAYHNGKNGAAKDADAAKKWLARYHDKQGQGDDDKNALKYLSFVLKTRLLEDKNLYADALKKLQTIGEKGNIDAMVMLADYYTGQDSLNDKQRGVAWLQKAAKSGHQASMVKLAKLYIPGYLVEKSSEKASFWLKKAIEIGKNPEATNLLNALE